MRITTRRILKQIRRLRRRENGAAVALIAVSMAALLGTAALAVDVGMLMNARTEAQRVADLAALAGAGVLAKQPGNASLAEQEAINFAGQNNVNGTPATVQSQDVDVDIPNGLVRVRVERISDSCGYGVPLMAFQKERTQLDDWAARKSPEQLRQYQLDNNLESLDGLPALRGEQIR